MSEGSAARTVLRTRAPAKVNLTLHVLGRRADGYHALESLVVFAGVADHLELRPGEGLSLVVEGPTAPMAGPADDNLVLRATRALAMRRPGLRLGAFRLVKRLPAAAGIGGGSSDAAAALRLLGEANGLAPDDPDLIAAARATGADVPVCLDPRARMMRGAGEEVGPALGLPPLFAVLVNPRVSVPTPEVFRALALSPGSRIAGRDHADVPPGPTAMALAAIVSSSRNDLEPAAIRIAPMVGEAIGLLRALPTCRLGRMSGSGATVFGLFDSLAASREAARAIRAARPRWWIRPSLLR